MAIAQRFNVNNSAVNGSSAGENLSLSDILPIQPITISTASADEKLTLGQAQAIPYGTATLSGTTYTVTFLNYPNTFNLYVGMKFLVKFNSAYTGGSALSLSIGGNTIPMMLQGSALTSISSNQIIEFTLYGTISSGTHTITGANASAGVTPSALNSALVDYSNVVTKTTFADCVSTTKGSGLFFVAYGNDTDNRPNSDVKHWLVEFATVKEGSNTQYTQKATAIGGVVGTNNKIYYRNKTNSNDWSSWTKLATETDLTSALASYEKINNSSIDATGDLNNVVTEGHYTLYPLNSIANTPTTDTSENYGEMIVHKSSVYISQQIFTPLRIYTRIKTQNAWTSWKKITTEDNSDSAYIFLDSQYMTKIKRSIDTVTLSFEGIIPSCPTGSKTTIFTLADKYRPTYTKYFDVKTNGQATTSILCEIKTDGTVNLYNYTGETVAYAYGLVTYVI